MVAPMVAVCVFALATIDEWRGSWTGTIDIINGSTVLTGPLLASIAAGIQVSAARVRPVSGASPRSSWVPYRSAVEAWFVGMASYLVMVLMAVVCTLTVPHGGPAQWWALAAGVLVLGLGALIGALAAHLAPTPITVLLVGPALFLVGAFAPDPLPAVLRFGPSGNLTGLQFSVGDHLGRFGLIVGIGLASAVVFGPWRRHGRRFLTGAIALAV
ncbi:hypothetical protein, partial [Nocardioides stalactiti]|uniref:hypothetical protein n=1 Tax=Nocardioides stalactiti TaxID=2755356 RepID=UPI0015FFF189